jgi:hypothetical protein
MQDLAEEELRFGDLLAKMRDFARVGTAGVQARLEQRWPARSPPAHL